ncbi:MAG: TonB-dependent receptor, partial [Actinomycetota bacterium]|nr:TonB-dependent receptor [Actinomycetota bacterium]
MTGRVTDTQGRPLVGVAVRAESSALQGTQETVTTANGDYLFKFLPAGAYVVHFTVSGMQPSRFPVNVAATEAVELNTSLGPAAVREDVTVVASNAAFVNTIESATSVKQDLLTDLPTARTMVSAVNLSPAAHSTGPGASFSINGAMSFENLFMVNGVQVQDNLRGDPRRLFIEDAIQETTITASGVSAEYGRFSGGVVNTVTKSGGNFFGGSYRASFDNDNWRSVSPFGENKIDSVNPVHEFTFGGPIVRDRLWFFAAGRVANAKSAEQAGYTETPFTFEDREKRFEINATQALAAGHRLRVAYTGVSHQQTNSAWPDFSSIMDTNSLVSPDLPENLVAVHYTGTVGSRFFVEAQYSARTSAFKRSGALGRDLIMDTPLRDLQTGAWWWSPNFCGVCTDEKRNNDNLVVKGSYFLSTGKGAHTMVFGYDGFNDKTSADNYQSGSDYHVWASGSLIEDGVIYPVIDPGFGTYIINWPVLEASQGTNFRTHSLFFNDSWSYNQHFSFNLGVRYDRNSGRDASGNLVVKDAMFSPRLGVAWDPQGDGLTSVNLSVGRYVSAISNGIAGSAAAAGNPSIFAYFYEGEPINTGSGPYMTTDAALRQVFDWYFANQPDPFQVDLQGVTRRIDDSLASPHSDEIAVGISRQLGRAWVRADVVNRTFGDFYAERVDSTTGQVADEFGQTYDLKVITNTDDLSRSYRALNLQAGYRGGSNLNVGASYTLSRLSGNQNGENVESGPLTSSVVSYP